MNLFLKKQLTNVSCTYQPLSFYKILKKFQSYWDVPFIMNKFFLVQIIFITFICLLTFFIVQNLKKFLQWTQSYEDVILWAQHLPRASFCFEKLLKSLSFTYQPLSSCKILEKFFLRIQSYEDAQFLIPKWPISPNENFFRKFVHEPYFFHSCLCTCQPK